ncbi:uncharacterized protein C13orf46 homolog isoform X1 [Tursiops truncatus]|uniref:uncharacterized protein C13orf46 homolog isoform X1 n=1 Tax=Tursiops truncatus TaxID=9739 RepID=UPI003CCF7C4D
MSQGPPSNRAQEHKGSSPWRGWKPCAPSEGCVRASVLLSRGPKAGRLEKDTTAAHRRHQLGPGAPPSAVSPGHLKAASGMAELQRSRCVGGLHQKGDPPSCIKTLCKELEPEGHGKDLRSDTEDARCQASPEEQRQDAAGQVRGRWKEAEPEASGQEEPDGREGADKPALEAKEGEPESVQLGDLLEKEARAFHFSNRSQRGGLSGTVLPRTRGLGQAPPELPQRPVCAPGWRRGTLTPACQTAQLLRERGSRQEVTLSLPLSGSPSPGPPQPRGSGAHRTLSKRGFPSPSPSTCRGGGELGLACIQGPWGPLHSPKHFSHC